MLTATTRLGWLGESSKVSMSSREALTKSFANWKSCLIGIRPGSPELDESAALCTAANRALNSASVEMLEDGAILLIA
jgi:hypothetical protein